ncbi:MAG: AAA family ATPase, partial [SAR324 cluster bacterium]|nr:AAA family ATPase [SAR324 cluster bacterium]
TRDGTYGITGDTVNTGARLKVLAKDDTILVSPDTQREIAAYFETTALEARELKGKGQPMAPFRIVGEMRGQKVGQQGFVGRQAELRQFASVIEACLESGQGQAVYVRGEAGIGKTHFVEECRRIAVKGGFACHSGLTLDFGIGKGRDAIRAIVRSMLGIAPGSGKEIRRAAAQQAIAGGLLTAEMEPYLNDLLDYQQPPEWRAIYDAMDNDTRNRGKRATFVGLVKAISAHTPLLVVVEDLHWAQGLALAHLAELTKALAEAPVVLIITSRIEGDPLDAAWRASTGGAPLLTMDLAPLRESEALEMAGEFMDATSRFATNCIARAEGNPLFLEQLLRNAEQAEEDAVPGSVQSLVLARMDRLEAHDKRALQAASILGQRFGLDVLRHLIESPAYSCDELIEHYLVRPEGEDYMFAHALIQEGVYTSLLKTTRRELHRRAAERFTGRDPILRAEHLARAEDVQAPQAFLEAAQAQAAVFRYESALQLAARGLELAVEQGQQFALTCFQGQMLQDLGSIPESVAAYEKALASAAGDVQRCHAWIGMAEGMRVTDQYEEALKNLDSAEAAADQAGLTLELAQLRHLRGNIYFPMGNLEGCQEQHEQAMESAREAGSSYYEARALGGLGDAYYMRGRMSTAYDHFGRCVELSRTHGFPRIEASYLYMVGWNALYMNQSDASLQNSRQAREIAARIGLKRAEILGRLSTARTLVEQGKMAEADTEIELGLQVVEALGASRFKPFFAIFQARSRLAQQAGHAQVTKLVEEAVQLSRSTGVEFIGPWVLSTLALVSNDPARSLSALEEGQAVLDSGCVGHNYLAFYRDAMEVGLRGQDWEGVERYAAALEEYTRPEPLPMSDFFIARGRALATAGQGTREEGLTQQLQQLREQAAQAGFTLALPAIEEALAKA